MGGQAQCLLKDTSPRPADTTNLARAKKYKQHLEKMRRERTMLQVNQQE